MNLLRWETDSRYYLAWIHRDLFGELVLSRWWGGRGSRRGGERHEQVTTAENAQRRLGQLARQRARRGYRLVRVDGCLNQADRVA